MIRPVDMMPEQRKDMLDLLDVLRARVEDGGVRGIVAVEIRADVDEPNLVHDAGNVRYAETIGFLEMAKMSVFSEATEQ